MTAKNHPAFDIETRLALLEQTNEHIYEALKGLNTRFDSMDKKIDKLDNKLETKIDKLEIKLDEKLDKLENKLNEKIDKLDGKIEKLDIKLDSKISSRFFWLLAFVVGGYASLLTLTAKGFHWF